MFLSSEIISHCSCKWMWCLSLPNVLYVREYGFISAVLFYLLTFISVLRDRSSEREGLISKLSSQLIFPHNMILACLVDVLDNSSSDGLLVRWQQGLTAVNVTNCTAIFRIFWYFSNWLMLHCNIQNPTESWEDISQLTPVVFRRLLRAWQLQLESNWFKLISNHFLQSLWLTRS